MSFVTRFLSFVSMLLIRVRNKCILLIDKNDENVKYVEGGGCYYVQIDEKDRLAHLAGGDCRIQDPMLGT